MGAMISLVALSIVAPMASGPVAVWSLGRFSIPWQVILISAWLSLMRTIGLLSGKSVTGSFVNTDLNCWFSTQFSFVKTFYNRVTIGL